MKINLPKSFEEFEQFKDGHLLECFKCLSKDARDYETKALHFSAHMFFKKMEIKKSPCVSKKLRLQKFHGKQKDEQTTHCFIIEIQRQTEHRRRNQWNGFGFVDKFAALFALRKKSDVLRSDISVKKWSSAYPHVTVELTRVDREKGSLFIVLALKAHI